MKKPKKLNNEIKTNFKESFGKEDLKKHLVKLGFSIQEKDWYKSLNACDDPGCPACSLENSKSTENQSIEDLFAPTKSESNVEFFPGSSIEDTNIYVDGVLLKGVTKATLEYCSETGDPTLKLEIVGFSVELDR